MRKKFFVMLKVRELYQLHEVVRSLKGVSPKVKRAEILLKPDIEGSRWTDRRIAEAFFCRAPNVEGLRQRLVERGFNETLDGVQRTHSPTPRQLDGKQEAQVNFLRLGEPPRDYAN